MKPSTPSTLRSRTATEDGKTELPPSTQLPKVVFGGSLNSNIVNKNTYTWVQLVCLLSLSALFVQQVGASTNTAVRFSMHAVGGNAEQRTSPTYGGDGGRIIVKTGIENINLGDGSDGPLTHDITLTTGSYNYTYVYKDIEGGGTTKPTITIDGDVIINCQGLFQPSAVVGKFLPDQAKPPRVRINAGHPIITILGMQFKLSHSATCWMSATDTNPAPVNSDGSGMDGGSVELFTTEAGDISCSGAYALGGLGRAGGDAGDGGDVTLVATGGDVLLSSRVWVDGGASRENSVTGNTGGSGGDAGNIYLSGIEVINEVPGLYLWANGGEGGPPPATGTIEHPYGSRGWDGGNGGGIVVCRTNSQTGSFIAAAKGGHGGIGGDGYSFPGITGIGREGFPGGTGGDGGAPGVIVGLAGNTSPGNGGDGGLGGIGEAGHLRTSPPLIYDSPGGKGGAGGNGGDAGGAGALPGKGIIMADWGGLGNGGLGNPHGAAGEAGLDGIIGDRAPAKPPTDGTGHYTYVLCVGTFDYEPEYANNPTNTPFLDGDRGAELVCEAFNRLPNVSLRAKALPLYTALPGNRERLIAALSRAARRLKPGDNFVLYINCHGGFNKAGEPGVTTGDEPIVLSSDGKINDGDERLRFQRDANDKWPLPEIWTDDYLTDNFRVADWTGVNKLFILDTCYAGGYWESGPLDSGDLNRLQRAAIIAASDEANTAGYDEDESGAKWGLLGQDLIKTLTEFETRSSIRFVDLWNGVREKHQGRIAAGQDAYVLDDSASSGIRRHLEGDVMSAQSADFVMTLILATNWMHLSFSSKHPLTTNGLELALDASPGLNCRIEVSTNLVSWTTLTNFVTTNSTIYFQDSSATNFNRRFYRAVVP